MSGKTGKAASAEFETRLADADIALDRDRFFRNMLRELAGTLQDVVGEQDARGFISVVGARIGDEIDQFYREALGKARLERPQVAAALVDLKRRIGGDFYVIEETDDKIVFGNRACPFGSYVEGRPALCMMTSNVFGRIAAENLGYAKISIEEAIARGDVGCRVVVYLDPEGEGADQDGREYFRVSSEDA